MMFTMYEVVEILKLWTLFGGIIAMLWIAARNLIKLHHNCQENTNRKTIEQAQEFQRSLFSDHEA